MPMNGASLKRLMTRALGAALAASLLILSPGSQALTAFAQSVQTGRNRNAIQFY